MASQLLFLGILFTVTLIPTHVQGTEYNESPKIDLGLSLVPAPHIILIHQKMKTPVLLNCSLDVTDQTLLPLSYKWLKDGQQVDLIHQKSRMQLLPNGSLLLQPRRNKSKNRTLDGIYDCLVTTATKNVVIARRVKVVIATIAKNFSKEPTSKEAFKGGVARFECSIRAEPVATYIWHKNDTQLPQDDTRFTSLLSGALQISNIDLSDAGFYWCQATTYLLSSQEQMANFGWKRGRQAELKVKADLSGRPPQLLASPQNISVLVGGTAEFECFADGNPMPTVAWRKMDSDVVFGPQKLRGHGNLRLAIVTPNDAGVYECTVSGRGRTLKSTAMLTVLEPPKLEQGPDSNKYPVSKALSTSCKVTGNPPPKISWYHNGVPILETDITSEIRDTMNGQTLFLYTLQKKNSGFYQCVAENSVGLVMAVALLTITQTPDAPPLPSNVKCTAINSTSFVVTWEHVPTYGLHPYVVSFQIVGDTKPPSQEFCLPNIQDSKQRCYINNRLAYTNYSVRVQAYTTKGASDLTDKVYVRTLPDIPRTVPMVSVTIPQFHSMLVSWTPLTIEESRGPVVAYKIYYRTSEKRDETSKEVSGNQTSYLITGVEPETEYEVLVIAATSVGYTSRDHWPWTKCITPPANASSPPRLKMKYINATSVWLEWQAPVSSFTQLEEATITGYSIELQSLSKLTEPVKKFTLPASMKTHVLTNLENDEFYKVTLNALTKQGPSSPTTSEFQLKELQYQLIPGNFHADHVQLNSVSLSWASVPGFGVRYEVCYREELDKSDRICQTSANTNLTVFNLESFTRYEFIVRAVMDTTRAADSENLIVQTTEDRPSPPLNLTAKVQQNSVQLHWLPPVKPNGVITYYVILYSKDTVNNDNIAWKRITQKGAETYAQLDDLESGRYLFKLIAGNKAGLSDDTDIVTAVPMCKTLIETSCSLLIDTTKGSLDVTAPVSEMTISKLTNIEIAIIVASIIGSIILIALLLMVARHFCYKLRSYAREQDPNASHSSIYCGNGHITYVSGHTGHSKPGNGHIHQAGNSPAGYRHEAIYTHESTPMLKQIPENEHSDSKGGPDGIPNGIIPNGIVKDSQKIGQTHYTNTPDLNGSNNSEELQGLMAAMLASAERGDTLGTIVGEKIAMSTFDDIDRSDYLGDNTSQDSGMGGRHAGMLGSSKDIIHTDGPSATSSPGESSLGRHQPGWEMGREVDEIGGVFIDRSTGAVIGEVSPRSRAIDKEEVLNDKVARGKHSEDAASNDRDSGHGSESKSHGGTLNGVSDEPHVSFGLCLDVPMSTSSSDMHTEELVVNELPPPPPPPPPLFMSSPPQPSTLSSSQQLTCSKNRNTPNNSRPQNRQLQRSQNISHTDLPPPPPSPPPITSPTLPPFQRSQAAVTATTSAATAELNSSGSNSIEKGGQQHFNDGSILPRQSEERVMVAFSPAPPPSTPPHIA